MKEIKMIVIALAILCLVIYFYWLLLLGISPDLPFNPSAWSNTGVFGDSFGGLTAIFSGVTILLLLYTIYLQRAEIAESRTNFTSELDTSRRQRYESEFFSMIEIHLTNLRHIQFRTTKTTEAGKEHFIYTGTDALLNCMSKGIIEIVKSNAKPSVYTARLTELEFDYSTSQYVRSLAVAYDSITRYSTETGPMQRYTKILKAYISLTELKFISLHCAYSERKTHNREELKSLKEFLHTSGLWDEAKSVWKGQIELPSIESIRE